MSARREGSLLAPLAVCALLAGWIALSVVNSRGVGFSLLLAAIANLIVYTDALDLALRLWVSRRGGAGVGQSATVGSLTDVSIDLDAIVPPETRLLMPLGPYAIIASVFNLEDRLDEFFESFEPYKDRMWLISDGSTDNTVLRLTQAGWRCVDDGVNRKKPGAIRRLLGYLPKHIETVLVIDPDVRLAAPGSTIDLTRFISDFQQSDAAAACPRIMIEPDGFLARFQSFEYALSFCVGRRSLKGFSITSGGVSIYRRDALARSLDEHSLSVYAEDLENALILLGHGERVYYDGRLVVQTEGPGTLPRWFSQRVGWYHGLIKVYIERFPTVLRISRRSAFAAYHYVVYLGVLSIGMHLIKMASATLLILSLACGLDALLFDQVLPGLNPEYFAAAATSYLALGIIALFTCVPKSERAYAAPIVPLYLCYALVHVIPMTVGYANYFALRLFGRRIYQDHYESPADPSLATQPAELLP